MERNVRTAFPRIGWFTKMTTKSLKVDRGKFEGIVRNLLDTKPVKREKVKVAKKKPAKLIPPQANH
jgi:hypothetical protein